MKLVEELDVALCRFQRERVHPRAIFANAIDATAVQLHDALIAAADVEDVGEAAILLFSERWSGCRSRTYRCP